jgi:hypothetical protein
LSIFIGSGFEKFNPTFGTTTSHEYILALVDDPPFELNIFVNRGIETNNE